MILTLSIIKIRIGMQIENFLNLHFNKYFPILKCQYDELKLEIQNSFLIAMLNVAHDFCIILKILNGLFHKLLTVRFRAVLNFEFFTTCHRSISKLKRSLWKTSGKERNKKKKIVQY